MPFPVYQIIKPDKDFDISIQLPPSKSMYIRKLLLDFLSGKYEGHLDSSFPDDVILMQHNLSFIRKYSSSGIPVVIEVDNAGAVARFLLALLSFCEGKWLIQGSERMGRRPVKPLVDALQHLGAELVYLKNKGYFPILVQGKKPRQNHCPITTRESSQYLSALLLVSPMFSQGLQISVGDKSVFSNPYVRMTTELLKAYGMDVNCKANTIITAGSLKRPGRFRMEHDWSSASFWYEIIALGYDSKVCFEGLALDSLQGDAMLPGLFAQLGVETTADERGVLLKKKAEKPSGFTFHFIQHPDLALPVGLSCVGLGIPSKLTGLENLKYKESDRLEGLIEILKQLGVSYKLADKDSLILKGGIKKKLKQMNPAGDHRLAMSLAPLALLQQELRIENPQVVTKSYPSFWQHLSLAGFEVGMVK